MQLGQCARPEVLLQFRQFVVRNLSGLYHFNFAETPSLFNCISDNPCNQFNGSNRIIIAWYDIGDFVRVRVGICHCDQRDADLVRFLDGQLFPLCIDHEDQIGHCGERFDPADSTIQLGEFTIDDQLLDLGKRLKFAIGLTPFLAIEIVDSLFDRGPICQRASQPAIVDVGHPATGRLLFDGALRLPLCTDKQDCAAFGDQTTHHLIVFVDSRHRLVQIDDVNSTALSKDILTHFRVPAPGPVPEMYAGLQQLLHGND